MQPHPCASRSSPPPLWALTPSAATVPTTPDLTFSPKVSEIVQKKAIQTKPFGKLSPLTIPSSPISPDPESSASPFSSTSTPMKYSSGKHRAGLPRPCHTIEYYDRLTNKVHASTASTSDTKLNRTTHEVPVIVSPASSSTSVGTSMKPIFDKSSPNFPIQPISYIDPQVSREQAFKMPKEAKCEAQ